MGHGRRMTTTKSMDVRTKATLLIGVFTAAAGIALAQLPGVSENLASAVPVVTEDDPAFDCTTMGNYICGPTNRQAAVPGRYSYGLLVEPWSDGMYGR